MLVGISEELMFIGIVLIGFLSKNGKVLSIIFSALLFASLHFVNVFGGLTFGSMAFQAGSAFVYGILAGCMRVRIKNIAPFMLFNFLWDMMLMSNEFVKSAVSIFTLGISGLELVLAIILIISVALEEIKNRKEKTA